MSLFCLDQGFSVDPNNHTVAFFKKQSFSFFFRLRSNDIFQPLFVFLQVTFIDFNLPAWNLKNGESGEKRRNFNAKKILDYILRVNALIHFPSKAYTSPCKCPPL